MFAKYPSIENHYQQKWIEQFIEKFGQDLTYAEYVITEKIHGANIQLIFQPNEAEFRIASRNQLTDTGFYNIGDLLADIDFTFVHDVADKQNTIIRLYGEVFGPGIQKGVDYGGKKRILFFDLRFGEHLVTQQKFFAFFKDYPELTVPVVHSCKGLDNALAFDTEFNSVLSDKEDNQCEGVVIKPFKHVFHNNAGSLFYIKKKNAKFMEKKQRTHKSRPEWSAEVNKWRETFLEYLNEERLESVYSKEGRITDPKLIGKYIGYIMKDATDTFLKEEDFNKDDFEKDECKYIMSMDNKVREWILQEVR